MRLDVPISAQIKDMSCWRASARMIWDYKKIESGKVYVNDPGPPKKKVHDIGWFNKKIAKDVPIPMMYLP